MSSATINSQCSRCLARDRLRSLMRLRTRNAFAACVFIWFVCGGIRYRDAGSAGCDHRPSECALGPWIGRADGAIPAQRVDTGVGRVLPKPAGLGECTAGVAIAAPEL